MAETDADDPKLLEASSMFLSRLGSDPEFARRFDSDPASALQELFPELKKVPKDRVAAIINADKATTEQLARLATANNVTPVTGLLHFLSRVASTRLVQSVASAVAAVIVGRLLIMQVPEPTPE
jgi:hypothetical protein